MKLFSVRSMAFTAGLFVLISCQKEYNPDGSGNPIVPVSSKVKMYIEDATNTPFPSIDSFDVTYDASNRIQSLVSRLDPLNKFQYTYNGSSNASLEIFNGGTVDIKELYYLNSNQLVDSSLQNNSTGDTSSSKFMYNANNQVIEELDYEYTPGIGNELITRISFEYDNAGNKTKETELDAAGDTLSVRTYTVNSSLFGPTSLLAPYIPVSFKNLVSSESVYDPFGGTTSVTNFTYTFDSNGRITSETSSQPGTSFSIVKKYIYE